MLFGMTCTTLGYSCIQIGVLARIMHGLRPSSVQRVQRCFTYNRGMLVALVCAVAGTCLLGTLVWRYVQLGLRLYTISHLAIFGLLLIVLAFQTFSFTLLLEMAQHAAPGPDHRL